MRKDIPIREVTEIGLALVPEKEANFGEIWTAHLVNLKDYSLKNILLNVEGRGDLGGSSRKTATMRYLISEIAPLSSHQIEVMLPDVMSITNQFWLSFSYDEYLYEKKIIVPHDARETMELVGIPVLHCQGLWFD